MKNKKGFTLIEILVVVILISIILVIAVPTVQKANINSKIRLCKNKLGYIRDSIVLHAKENSACIENSDSLNCRNIFNNCNLTTREGKEVYVCTTSIGDIARNNIIEYDEERDILNPLDKTKLNDMPVQIIYDQETKRISTEFLVDKPGVAGKVNDNNFDITCGKTKISEQLDTDSGRLPSILGEKKDFKINRYIEDATGNYNLYDEKTDKITASNKTYKAYCGNNTPSEDYVYNTYEKVSNKNELNCKYSRSFHKITINYNAYQSEYNITNQATNNLYKWGTKFTINYNIKERYELEEIACSNSSSCNIDTANKKIEVTVPKENLSIEIKTKPSLTGYEFSYYLQNADTDNYTKTGNTNVVDIFEGAIEDAEEICENNELANSKYERTEIDKTNKKVYCFYKRNTYSITVNKGTNVTGYTLNPTSSDGKYRIGQKINLTYTFASNYGLDTVTCNPASSCINNATSTEITMPNQNVTIDITAKVRYTYTVI